MATARVVDNLSLNIPKGTVYGFLGRNGAGKSTTIKMLVGMVHPDSGPAQILGDNCERLTPQTRARVAYMAEGHPLYAGMTIRQMVELHPARFTTTGIRSCWNRCSIISSFRARPDWASCRAGNRPRSRLALAIAPDPELLILDDPTLGLDTIVRRDFLESMIGHHSAPRPDDFVQLAYPGRRRTRGRSHRRSWSTACCGSIARPKCSKPTFAKCWSNSAANPPPFRAAKD